MKESTSPMDAPVIIKPLFPVHTRMNPSLLRMALPGKRQGYNPWLAWKTKRME